MQFSVPQFIDVEDTIVGPLTAKQAGYLGLGGVVIFMSTILLDPVWAAIISIPFFLVCIALAFYKPNGMPLIGYIEKFLLFGARPKVYVWRREPDGFMVKRAIKRETIKDVKSAEYRIVSRNRLQELAWMLDTRQAVETEGAEGERE